MKKIDAIYYFFMAFIFLLACLGFDFFDIKKQVVAIFITEFASVLITYGHIFSVNWQNRAPAFLKEKESNMQIIGTYLFFFVWAGLILLRNNYIFAFTSFIFSASIKGLRIANLNFDSSEIKDFSILSLFQFVAMFLSMLIGVVLSHFVIVERANFFWGIIYFTICGILIYFYPLFAKQK